MIALEVILAMKCSILLGCMKIISKVSFYIASFNFIEHHLKSYLAKNSENVYGKIHIGTDMITV